MRRGSEPTRSVAFDRAATYYDRTRGYPPGVAERVAEVLCHAGDLGPNSNVLEVGVGTGRIALPLARRVGRVVGIDISRPMLHQLLRKAGGEGVLPLIGDITALPFRAERFDAVVGVHIFHLVPEWQRALAEIKRVLTPGGRLLTAGDDWLLRELWQEANSAVPQLENVGVAGGQRDFPAQAGFQALGRPHELRYIQRVDLALLVREIEERVWSSTWRRTPDELAQLVAAMQRAILSRYGKLDAVIDVERTFSVDAYGPA